MRLRGSNGLVALLALAPGCASQSCPSALHLTNGGFERGKFAPWYFSAPSPADPKQQIVSPGYQSQHALELNVAAANFSDASILHPPIGQQCQGSYYRMSYAINWGTYAGPPSSEETGCKVDVGSSYCYGHQAPTAGVAYAARGAGWKHYTYTCSAMKTGSATFTVDFSCFGNATYEIPAFAFQLDSFNITLLGTSRMTRHKRVRAPSKT